MKKRYAFTILFAMTMTSCNQILTTTSTSIESSSSNDDTTISTSEEPSLTNKEKFKLKKENSSLADSNFKNGFSLLSVESPTAYVEKIIDYNGEAETDYYGDSQDSTTYWSMCQWWSPYNFKDAEYSKENNIHHYENESRVLEVDPVNGTLKMELDSYIEYQKRFGGPLPVGESWAHFLIQQSFPNELQFNPINYESLNISFDIRVDEATYKGSNETPIGKEAAQLLLYLKLYNNVPEDSDPNEVGKRGQGIWFGVPIFDTRYDYVSEYIGFDAGFEGATNTLIYSMCNKDYMGTKFEIGKTYSVDVNVMDNLKQAFIYAVTKGYMPNCSWENLTCHYMNFGWELPGEYKVSSTLSNLDIYVS